VDGDSGTGEAAAHVNPPSGGEGAHSVIVVVMLNPLFGAGVRVDPPVRRPLRCWPPVRPFWVDWSLPICDICTELTARLQQLSHEIGNFLRTVSFGTLGYYLDSNHDLLLI
jgi:hypothetical protein